MLVSDCISLVNTTLSLVLRALVDSSFVECKKLDTQVIHYFLLEGLFAYTWFSVCFSFV